MSEAPFDLDLEALRNDVHQPADGGEATRLRVLHSATVVLPRRQRLRKAGVALTVSVGLVALTYLFATRSPVPRSAPARPRVEALPQGMPAEPSVPAPAPAPALAPAPAPKKNSEAPTPTPQAPRRVRPAKVEAAPLAAPEPVTNAPGPELEQEPVPVAAGPVAKKPVVSAAELQALYMTAHRLHFRGAPAQALAAWDAYLAGAPQGPAAVEARFNRAVTLVRLGRNADARAELEPFARGDYGSFRKADAIRLLRDLR